MCLGGGKKNLENASFYLPFLPSVLTITIFPFCISSNVLSLPCLICFCFFSFLHTDVREDLKTGQRLSVQFVQRAAELTPFSIDPYALLPHM